MATYSGQNVEDLLEEIASRCLRNAARAVERFANACDEREAVCADADLAFAGAIARATVINLHHRQGRGEVDDMAAARIGLTLVETLRLVVAHTNRVMDGASPLPYNRSVTVAFPHESDHLPRRTARCTEPSLRTPIRSAGDRRVP